ncbi:MAG: hypothetical protein LBT93_01135 [Treponema sp.]|jgi:hypothetical protein|nr:hypothetical protein [Treponema sp.]
MLDIDVFDPALPFFKGNIHCHSTLSDGEKTREKLVKDYQNRGYHFLCISDHDIYVDSPEFNREDFILLPGFECAADLRYGSRWVKTHHVNALAGTKGMIAGAARPGFKQHEQIPPRDFRGAETAGEMGGQINRRGFFCIYNHPCWSMVAPEDMGTLEGYTAIEIYNHGCEVEQRTGGSPVFWDILLRGGRKIFAVATDDNHNKYPDDSVYSDSYGGWICVNAAKLTHEDIVSAILAGRYYSSCGPVIKNYGVRGGEIFVESSPVRAINFVTDLIGKGQCRLSEDSRDSLTAAAYSLSGREKYIRIECVDQHGRTAWTNPLFPA